MKPLRIHNLAADETDMELSGFMEQTGMPDLSEYMAGGPDILNFEGHRIYFVEFDTGGCRWIVYLDTGAGIKRERIEKILLSFFSEGWEDIFEHRERRWEEFKHNCIAYRGPQGVFYEIWKYKQYKNRMLAPINIHSEGQPPEIWKLKENRSKERMDAKPAPDIPGRLQDKVGGPSIPKPVRGSTGPVRVGALLEPLQQIINHPGRERLLADFFRDH